MFLRPATALTLAESCCWPQALRRAHIPFDYSQVMCELRPGARPRLCLIVCLRAGAPPVLSPTASASLKRCTLTQAKLRAGHGEAVCVVLSKLCDEALANQQFRISPIEYPTDVYPEEAPVDDDEEVSADIADTVAPTADDEEDDDYQLSRKEVKKEESKDTKIIESTIDPNAWKVEVEKVAPLLKMRMDSDNKEWRTHLEHTKELQGNIQTKVPMTQDTLAKLSETISQAIEAIRSREKTINSQYKKEVTDYTEVQEQLQEVMKRFDERNREVPKRKRTHTRSRTRTPADVQRAHPI